MTARTRLDADVRRHGCRRRQRWQLAPLVDELVHFFDSHWQRSVRIWRSPGPTEDGVRSQVRQRAAVRRQLINGRARRADKAIS